MGIFNIDFGIHKNKSLEISDVFGKRLDYIEHVNQINEFDMSDYAPGTYLINIMPDNLIFQIIKQ